MHADTLAAELLDLSTSTQAWRLAHPHDAPGTVAALRPALEAFQACARRRQLEEARARRLAAAAVRIALAPGDAALPTVLTEVNDTLGALYSLGTQADREVRMAPRVRAD